MTGEKGSVQPGLISFCGVLLSRTHPDIFHKPALFSLLVCLLIKCYFTASPAAPSRTADAIHANSWQWSTRHRSGARPTDECSNSEKPHRAFPHTQHPPFQPDPKGSGWHCRKGKQNETFSSGLFSSTIRTTVRQGFEGTSSVVATGPSTEQPLATPV